MKQSPPVVAPRVPWLALCAVGIGAAVLFRSTFLWIWQSWRWPLDSYHPWPIALALALALLWRACRALERQPSLAGWLPVLPMLVAALWAQGRGLWTGAALALLATGLALLWRALGARSAARFLLPAAALALALPLHQELSLLVTMARGVAILSAAAAELVNGPVALDLLSGRLFYTYGDLAVLIPAPLVRLADGTLYAFEPICGGIEKVWAMLLLITLRVGFSSWSWRRSLVVLALASLLAYGSKVVDVAAVLLLTPEIGQGQTLALYHGWLSYLTFGVALAAVLALGSLRRPVTPR